jgi:hypothetical protein
MWDSAMKRAISLRQRLSVGYPFRGAFVVGIGESRRKAAGVGTNKRGQGVDW